jgi:hypothetical protein
MALVMPLLLVLLFGAVELGSYFWNEHIVQKAVREGARYAARQPVTGFLCPGATVDSDTEDRIKTVTRTGLVSGGTTRVRDWDDAEISITVECQATPSGIYADGIYKDLPGGARTVTVVAAVPYLSLFGAVGGFDPTGLQVRAQSHAAVFGI